MSRHPAVTEINQVFVESFNKWRAPRSIGMRLIWDCMRKTIRDFRKTEDDFEPPDERGRDNMSYGSAYEYWMIDRLKEAGLLKYGGKFREDHQVNVRKYEGNGYMDALVWYKGEDIAVEIKTKGARDFERIARDKDPDDSHYMQLMAYMHFLGIKKGWLIYIDREKHYEAANGGIIPRWEILEIEYQEKIGKKTEKRLIKLSEYKLNPDKEPKKEPESSDDPRCRYCSHRKYCWNESPNNPSPGASAIAKRLADNRTARGKSTSKSKVSSS